MLDIDTNKTKVLAASFNIDNTTLLVNKERMVFHEIWTSFMVNRYVLGLDSNPFPISEINDGCAFDYRFGNYWPHRKGMC